MSSVRPHRLAQDPTAELADFLDTLKGPAAVSPQNPLSQQAAPSANQANPMMNPSNPGAFNNPSNPQLNPDLPGSTTNPSNPAYNAQMPGAQNNPSNPQFNPSMPGATNNPANPALNPAFPGSITNPSNPIHNPDYPDPSKVGQPPTNLGPNASFPPRPLSAWHLADNYTQDTREWADPTEPRASKPPMQMGCTCPEGHKLDCPIHGMNAENEDADHSWFLPENTPVGYPQDQPRGWTDAVQSSKTAGHDWYNRYDGQSSAAQDIRPAAQPAPLQGLSTEARDPRGDQGQAHHLWALPHSARRLTSANPEVDWVAQNYPQFQHVGYNANGHPQYVYSDPQGNGHLVTGWIGGGSKKQAIQNVVPNLKRQMYKCLNGACDHVFTEDPESYVAQPEPGNEPVAPRLNPGMQVGYEGQPHYITAADTIDGAHVYDLAHAQTGEPTQMVGHDELSPWAQGHVGSVQDVELGSGHVADLVDADAADETSALAKVGVFGVGIDDQHVGSSFVDVALGNQPLHDAAGRDIVGLVGDAQVESLAGNRGPAVHVDGEHTSSVSRVAKPFDDAGRWYPTRAPEPQGEGPWGWHVTPPYNRQGIQAEGLDPMNSQFYGVPNNQQAYQQLADEVGYSSPEQAAEHEHRNWFHTHPENAAAWQRDNEGGEGDIWKVNLHGVPVDSDDYMTTPQHVGPERMQLMHRDEGEPIEPWDLEKLGARTAAYGGMERETMRRMLQGLPVTDEQYLYHVAPTTERERIRTHGLQAANPNLSHPWLPDQHATGVYCTTKPRGLGMLLRHPAYNQPMDVWRFPQGRGEQNTGRSEFIRPEGVAPDQLELHQPWEHVAEWPTMQPLGSAAAGMDEGHANVGASSIDLGAGADFVEPDIMAGDLGTQLVAGVELDVPAGFQVSAHAGHGGSDQLLAERMRLGADGGIDEGRKLDIGHRVLGVRGDGHGLSVSHGAHGEHVHAGWPPLGGQQHGVAAGGEARSIEDVGDHVLGQHMVVGDVAVDDLGRDVWSLPVDGDLHARILAHNIPPNGTHQCPSCGLGVIDNGWTGWTPVSEGQFGQRSWQCPQCGADWKAYGNQPLPVGHSGLAQEVKQPRLLGDGSGRAQGDGEQVVANLVDPHIDLGASGGIGHERQLLAGHSQPAWGSLSIEQQSQESALVALSGGHGPASADAVSVTPGDPLDVWHHVHASSVARLAMPYHPPTAATQVSEWRYPEGQTPIGSFMSRKPLLYDHGADELHVGQWGMQHNQLAQAMLADPATVARSTDEVSGGWLGSDPQARGYDEDDRHTSYGGWYGTEGTPIPGHVHDAVEARYPSTGYRVASSGPPKAMEAVWRPATSGTQTDSHRRVREASADFQPSWRLAGSAGEGPVALPAALPYSQQVSEVQGGGWRFAGHEGADVGLGVEHRLSYNEAAVDDADDRRLHGSDAQGGHEVVWSFAHREGVAQRQTSTDRHGEHQVLAGARQDAGLDGPVDVSLGGADVRSGRGPTRQATFGVNAQDVVHGSRVAWTHSDEVGGMIPDEGDEVDGSRVHEMDNLTTHLQDGRAMALDQVWQLMDKQASDWGWAARHPLWAVDRWMGGGGKDTGLCPVHGRPLTMHLKDQPACITCVNEFLGRGDVQPGADLRGQYMDEGHQEQSRQIPQQDLRTAGEYPEEWRTRPVGVDADTGAVAVGQPGWTHQQLIVHNRHVLGDNGWLGTMRPEHGVIEWYGGPGNIPTPEHQQAVNQHTGREWQHSPMSWTAAEDYRGQHTAPGPDYGWQMHDMTGVGLGAPDFYEHPEYYSFNDPAYDRESLAAIFQARGNPEQMVTIHRAGPVNQFNTGDWVTPSLGYAQHHAMHPTDPALDGPVWSAQVPAKHLWTSGDDLNEWGYHGPAIQGQPVQRTAAANHIRYNPGQHAYKDGLGGWAQQYGRGMVMGDGSVYTWPEHRGSHQDVAMGLNQSPVHTFMIRSSGEYYTHDIRTQGTPETHAAIAAADPRLSMIETPGNIQSWWGRPLAAAGWTVGDRVIYQHGYLGRLDGVIVAVTGQWPQQRVTVQYAVDGEPQTTVMTQDQAAVKLEQLRQGHVRSAANLMYHVAGSSSWFKPRGREWGKGLYHIPTQTLVTWPESDNIEHQGMAHQMGWQTGRDTRTLDITPDGIVHPRGPMEDEHAQSIGAIDPRLAVQPRSSWTWEASHAEGQIPADMPVNTLSTHSPHTRTQAHEAASAHDPSGPTNDKSPAGDQADGALITATAFTPGAPQPTASHTSRRGHPRSRVFIRPELAGQRPNNAVDLIQPAMQQRPTLGSIVQGIEAIDRPGHGGQYTPSDVPDPDAVDAVTHWSQPAVEPWAQHVAAKDEGDHDGCHDDDGMHAWHASKPSVFVRDPLLARHKRVNRSSGWDFPDSFRTDGMAATIDGYGRTGGSENLSRALRRDSAVVGFQSRSREVQTVPLGASQAHAGGTDRRSPSEGGQAVENAGLGGDAGTGMEGMSDMREAHASRSPRDLRAVSSQRSSPYPNARVSSQGSRTSSARDRLDAGDQDRDSLHGLWRVQGSDEDGLGPSARHHQDQAGERLRSPWRQGGGDPGDGQVRAGLRQLSYEEGTAKGSDPLLRTPDPLGSHIVRSPTGLLGTSSTRTIGKSAGDLWYSMSDESLGPLWSLPGGTGPMLGSSAPYLHSGPSCVISRHVKRADANETPSFQAGPGAMSDANGSPKSWHLAGDVIQGPWGTANEDSPYRTCPSCGEPEFEYIPRYENVHGEWTGDIWHCHNCGHGEKAGVRNGSLSWSPMGAGPSSGSHLAGAESTMQWQPGNWGKGLILDDQLHTWPTEVDGFGGIMGDPHHGAYLRDHGIDIWNFFNDYDRWHDPIVISPQGWYTVNDPTGANEKTIEPHRFAQAGGGLKFVPDVDKWRRRIDSHTAAESLLPIRMQGCPSCGGPHVDEETGECTDCGYAIPYDGAEQLQGWNTTPPHMREGPGTVGEWDTTGLEPHWGSRNRTESGTLWRMAAQTRNQLLQLAQTLPEDQSEPVHQWPDSWSIRKLRTYGDMHREGQLMSNCFSPYNNDTVMHDLWREHPDAEHDAEGETYLPGHPYHSSSGPLDMSVPIPASLYSLRDPDNLPHGSFDPSQEDGYNGWLGRHNSSLKPEYVERVENWRSQLADENGSVPPWYRIGSVAASWKLAETDASPWEGKMYHGSPRGLLGPVRTPFWSTSHEPEASVYGGRRGEKAIVHPVSVRFQRPLHLFGVSLPDDWQARAQAGQHDGVVLHHPEPSGSRMVDPDQYPQRTWAIALDPGSVVPGHDHEWPY